MAIKGDFISFTYNGVHSTELGIVHVSTSNRYTDALLPTIQDKTVLAPGSDGTYFFGSYYTERLISLNIAYDEVSESLFRLARKVFGDLHSHPLIFDEEPYKVYYAKVTGTPQYTYIPFSTPRVYKGEGTLTFTCYEPFAHTLNNLKYLSLFPGSTIDKELSGDLVSFNDGIDNLKKLEAKFNASQDFNNYSKPWPAGGGANKWDCEYELGNILSDGSDGTSTSYNRTKNYIPVTGGEEYRVICPTEYKRVYWYDADKAFISSDSTQHEVKTAPANAAFARMMWPKDDVPDPSTTCAINYPSSVTEWTPYSNICPISGLTGLSVYVSPTSDVDDAIEYTEDWTSQAGTVYGGTIDVVTGVLTVDRAYVDMGTLDYTKYNVSQGTLFRSNAISGVSLLYNTDEFLCSMYKVVQASNRSESTISVSVANRVDVIDSRYSDSSSFKTAVSGVQLVCELATPLMYQLTPQEVSVLEGLNNIWSSSGNVTVIYNKLTGKIEDWKIEWNPSANLLDELGLYDSYNSTTGFKLYNPGDIETDFKLIIPTSLNFTINGIVASNSLTGESRILTTSITSAKEGDISILFNSKTNLIEGLNAQGARTGKIYNDCIVSGEWFKIPLTTDGNWYLLILDYSNTSETAPEIIYDYLYF